jgi:uncharacterized protein (TIGR03067 family)
MKKLSVLLVLPLLLGAEGDKDNAKKTTLEGVWKAVTATQDGKEQADTQEHTLTFTGDTFTIARNGETVIKGTFNVDAAKKPSTIDMLIKESKGDRHNGKSVVGIYELDGDSLKWCAAEPGTTERPAEFKSEQGDKRLLVKLEREKK